MFAKKGQAQGAATLIVIMTVLILLYVLMLPPADRAELLGEDGGALPTNGYVYPNQNQQQVYVGKFTLMDEVPGSIDYTALNELEIPLSSFTLYKSTGSRILENYNSFYIKNGAGDVISKNITFETDNPQDLSNIILTFKTKKHVGVLTILLNGDIIYQYEIDSPNPDPIKISKSALKNKNSLEFKVSGVGWQFWKTNEYSFDEVKLIADVTDSSRDQGENSFFISESQGKSIETATLRFSPDCKSDDVGKLTITLNGRSVFSAVPDCGSPNYVYFAPNMITIGKNKIEFKTDAGSYLLDLIKVRLEFKDNQIPVYYFPADAGLFVTGYNDVDAECGKKDNFCPKGCDEDNDYDCCMTKYTTPYWCVADTANEDDKCVGAVVADNMNRCPTNYIKRNGDVSDVGQSKCGDNTDGDCPSGCSIYNDKDCCFNVAGDQFWCDYMPTNGLNSRCVNSVSLGQCDICPTGYKGESDSPICKPSKTGYEVNELKPGYYIMMTMKFADNYQDKEADLYINGHLVRLQTDSDTYQKDISTLVEPDTNSIEIVPFSKLDIRSLKVEVLE